MSYKATSTTAKEVQTVVHDYTLFYIVALVLLVFYIAIVWVLRSSEVDRKTRLNKVR